MISGLCDLVKAGSTEGESGENFPDFKKVWKWREIGKLLQKNHSFIRSYSGNTDPLSPNHSLNQMPYLPIPPTSKEGHLRKVHSSLPKTTLWIRSGTDFRLQNNFYNL